MSITKKTLDQKHECYDAERWCDLAALSKGGKLFHTRINRFLPKNPMEPELRHGMRKKQARYYSYIGAISNLYVAWLFAAGFEIKPYKRDSEKPIDSPDKFYSKFQANVGGETSLKTFMKDRFREAMTTGHAVWVCELPPADPSLLVQSQLDYERLGLGNASLLARDASDLLDWECDEKGQLEWAILKSKYKPRKSWAGGRNTTVEQWRVYDRELVHTFELEYDDQNPPTEDTAIPLKSSAPHGFKRVPVMRVSIPEEMCIGEQTHDAQIAHFQLDAALSWAMKMTCYPMPIFHLEGGASGEGGIPTMGAGHGIVLGEKETMSWSSPPGDTFQTIAKDRDSKRDEIFRIVHQMAQGLDNNAETVGRSADSKEIDAAATRIMLNAYGEIVGKVIEETFELISEARGDRDYEWSVKGFSGYDTATASSLIANVKFAKDTGVPSQTFMREISKKAALSLVPELEPKVKDTIRREIEAYNFEVDGNVLEERLQDKQLESTETVADQSVKSQEKMSANSLKSQEKTAAAKAKADAKKPKPSGPGNAK